MASERIPGSAFFPIAGVDVSGWRFTIGGKAVVIDCDYGDAMDAIAERLRETLAEMRPVLKVPIREIVLPKCPNPAISTAPGAAHYDTGKLCLWFPVTSQDGLPFTDIRTLEHEGAHLLFKGGGPPSEEDWNAARAADAPNIDGRMWVSQDIEDVYPEVEHLSEDWARTVEGISASSREGDDDFRAHLPARADIVKREVDFP